MFRSWAPVWWLCLAALALHLLGCAHRRAHPGPPFDPDEPWWTLQSPNFAMHTNLEPHEARAMLEEFEARHDLLVRVLHPDRPPPTRTTRLIALRRDEELRALVPDAAGYFVERLPGSDPMPVIVVGGTSSPHAVQVWQHELTHRLVNHALGDLPSWLEEGLACYYSMAAIEGDVLVLGRQPPDFAFTKGPARQIATNAGLGRVVVPLRDVTPPSRLLTTHRHDFSTKPLGPVGQAWAGKANEAVGWAVVHFLVNGPPEYNEAFAAALARAAEGRSLTEALLERLPPPERLDRDFARHLRREQTMLWRTPVQRGPRPSITIEGMRDADVLVLLAKFGSGSLATSGSNRTRLAKALRVEPEHAEAIYLRGLFACADGLYAKCARDLRAAIALKPDHPGYWTGLLVTQELYPKLGGSAELRRAERERAWDRLAAIATDWVDLVVLAGSLATHGELERAKPFARRAIAADSNRAECFGLLAAIEDALGNHGEAVKLVRLAIDRVPAHREVLRRQLTAALAEYERKIPR